ncbi:hypothetical protein Tco_0308007 [Tanacetum coccineum]
MKNNPVCKENASNVFRKEREQYHEIQDLKAQMLDKNMVINELKKLILVTKGKVLETQFDKPYVVRQPNAQRIPKPSVLGKPTPFSNSPEMRSFSIKIDGMFRIASTTAQNRTPQLPHASRNTNPHMSKSSGVIHTTSVYDQQLKSYKSEEKSNTRTSNANAVLLQECEPCVFNLIMKLVYSSILEDLNAKLKSLMHPIVPYSIVALILLQDVQLILFIVDSGCTKHMMGNLKLLCNFVEKFMGTVHFGNDQFAPILGYGDLIQGNVMIKRVYYVEGLNHNLFSVGQFCDADLEVAFRKSTCFVRDLQGNDLLTGNRGSISTQYLFKKQSSTPSVFMLKHSPTQAWLLASEGFLILPSITTPYSQRKIL